MRQPSQGAEEASVMTYSLGPEKKKEEKQKNGTGPSGQDQDLWMERTRTGCYLVLEEDYRVRRMQMIGCGHR